jgi:hypothetical protein
MGLFDGSGDPSGGMGLMGMYANPQTAALLGMSQGLLSASGPSRIPVSMGQAMGAGMQGMQQGAGNAFQMQQQMLKMRAMQGLMGGDTTGMGGAPAAQPSQPNPTMAQGAPVTGAANAGPMSGLSAGMGGMAPQMPQQAAPAAGPASAAGTIYGRSPQQLFQQGMLMNVAGIQGGGDLMRVAVEHDPTLAMQMPTDISKMGYQAGMTPAQLQAANLAGVTKATNIPLVAGRAGAPMYDYQGNIVAMAPKIPDNAIPNIQGGRITGVTGLPGATDVEKANAAAGAIGKAYGTNTTGYSNGKPVFVNQGALSDQLTGGSPGAGVPGFTPFQNAIRQVESQGSPAAVNPASGAAGSMQVTPTGAGSSNPGFGVRPAANNSPHELQRVGADYANAMQQHYGNDTDAAVAYNWGPQNADKWISAGRPWKMLPPQTQSYVGQVHAQMQNFSGQGGSAPAVAPENPAGYSRGQEDLQGDLSKKWTALNSANSQAQTTVSYLDNIRSLAQKAALGQQSDKLNYVNGLLSLAGSEKATDTVTANNLLDKYSNQIVSRLGSGDLGTDAARSILQSAYPNSHMNKDAINEAADNLVGASQMTQAKARLLQGDFNSRNPQAYSQKEMTFDQNADPRIWQFQNMNPQQRQAFKASMTPAQQASFGKQMRNLESLGVFQ